MAAWTYWLPDLLPTVPGCPQVLALHEIKRAAQDLMRASRAWQAELPAQAVAADAATVTLTPPSGAEVVQVERAWVDGKRLPQVAPDVLDMERGDNWTEHTGAGPTHFVQLQPEVLRLYPIPTAPAATGLVARVSLCPADSAEGLDDGLARRYRNVILAGARARLMLMPGKAWSSPELALAAAAGFQGGVDSAHHDAIRGFGRGMPRARPNWC